METFLPVDFNSEDKLLHFIIFLLLSLSLASMAFLLFKKDGMLQRFTTIGFTLTLIAIVEEYRQFPLLGRSTELLDAIYSIAGAWTGIIILMIPCMIIYRIHPFYYIRKTFLATVLFLTILIPMLFGVSLLDERPMDFVQNKEVDLPVFNYSKEEEGAGSLKQELEKIAFGRNTAQTFLESSKYETAEQILGTYEVYFNKLRLYASTQSDLMFEKAVDEYQNRHEDDSFSIFKYLKKYKESGIGLSGEVEEMFNAIYQKLEVELEANGHESNLAEPFKEQYEKEKRARITNILKFIKSEVF